MRKMAYGRRGRARAGEVSWTVIGVAYGLGVIIAILMWASIHNGAGSAMGQAFQQVEESMAVEKGEVKRQAVEKGEVKGQAVEKVGGEAKAEGEGEGSALEKGEAQSRERTGSGADGTGGNSGAGGAGGAFVLDRKGQEGRRGALPSISVFLMKEGKVETVPLETYVEGVVAAEMPLMFRPAALEAQAVAARTYAIRRLWLGEHAGTDAKKADVTDTQEHQAYLSLTEMKRLKEDDREGWEKVRDAVAATKGRILVYEGEPIEALFFSTSNGYTENSEDVFSVRRPYLRSVESPWDQAISDRAKQTVEMELTEFYELLGVKTAPAAGGALSTDLIRVLERTAGRRVKTLLAGDKRLKGTEVRQLLGLRSASFEWKAERGMAVLTVYGYGHGVGMSQWGAEGMARAGDDASHILAHYYKGAKLASF